MSDDWGFCRICAFEVPIDADSGLLTEHRYSVDLSTRVPCKGSLTEPTEQPAPEAAPLWDSLGDDEENEDGEHVD